VTAPGRVFVAAVLALAAGCQVWPHGNPAVPLASTRPLQVRHYDDQVRALVAPPLGWRPEPLKTSRHHTHQVWLSPTGDTAYGVIHFSLPLPVGEELALLGFIAQMKRTEGDAVLLAQQFDANLPGIRFVAEGGRYQIRANLLVAGWQGWAVYAGTLRGKPVLDDELELAIAARENTKIGPAK